MIQVGATGINREINEPTNQLTISHYTAINDGMIVNNELEKFER
jgi:hypothetical protein